MSGWGPEVSTGGGGSTPPAPGSPQLPFIPGSYDDVQLTRDALDNIIQIRGYRSAALIVTINLTYNANGSLIEAKEA